MKSKLKNTIVEASGNSKAITSNPAALAKAQTLTGTLPRLQDNLRKKAKEQQQQAIYQPTNSRIA